MIEFEFTDDDFAAFEKASSLELGEYRNHPEFGKEPHSLLLWLTLLIFGVGACFVGWTTGFGGYDFHRGSFISTMALETYFVVFIIAIIVFYVRGLIRRQRKFKSMFWKGKHIVKIDNSGVTRERPGESLFLSWERVSSFRNSQNHFFLFAAPAYGITIPKRAFTKDQAAETFAQEVRDYLSKAKK